MVRVSLSLLPRADRSPNSFQPIYLPRARRTTAMERRVADSILELIGWTPLVKLNRITRGLTSTIYAKLEYFNPGGSVKDRVGLSMISDAERRGIIKPGCVIVEPTSGNTGAGLALAALVRGYKIIFTVPDKMSSEKIDLLKAFGAKVIITPSNVPPDHPASYVKVAERIVRETQNAFMPNQYTNPSNPSAHYQTTGPEIWKQTGGENDVPVAGVGGGGGDFGKGKKPPEKEPPLQGGGGGPPRAPLHPPCHKTAGAKSTHKN